MRVDRPLLSPLGGGPLILFLPLTSTTPRSRQWLTRQALPARSISGAWRDRLGNRGRDDEQDPIPGFDSERAPLN